MRLTLLAVSLSLATASFAQSTSYYPVRLEDKAATYLTGAKGDGVADDSDALQKAIDDEQTKFRQGVVFVPEGRYRITKTIYVWPGIRVIGYGAHRPTIVLGDNTPGFQQGEGLMVFFTGGRPMPRGANAAPRPPPPPFAGTVPPTPMNDGSPGTFYSAWSNIDIEIGAGDQAAVGFRFRIAQHTYITHVDFRLGSGLAGIHDAGNEMEDLHFHGGQYGVITQKPSPGWQFTLLDSSFDGQSVAAIKEHEAGLVLRGATIRDVPAAISIDPGFAEELWIKDSRFENISGPAVTISNENNGRTQISMEDVACDHVPVFVKFRESGKEEKVAAPMYRVDSFEHGLVIADGAHAAVATTFKTTPITAMPAVQRVIRDLPARDTWVNIRDLGAKGDVKTDDTAAFQKAIAEHKTLYIPMGVYKISKTLALRPDTVLIGLHPSATMLYLEDSTPGFDGVGGPVPLMSTPAGGTNIVTGIGLYTGGINSRASAMMWMAGKDSLMDDVRFLGGHGTNNPDGSRQNPYNNTHTADPDLNKKWDAQFPSLWILDGGGGTFANIWTPVTFSQAGLAISNTTTEGHIYELSSEHHVRNEVKLDRVANWEIFSLQTEEELGESRACLALQIDNSKNVLIANLHSYRVVGSYQTYPDAIRVSHSTDIRFRNLHIDSNSKVSVDDGIYDVDHDAHLRWREIGSYTAGEKVVVNAPVAPVVKATKRLATGFYNISGSALDPQGNVVFVDTHVNKVYRYVPGKMGVDLLRDAPLDIANLAIDKAGNVMAVSYVGNGTVYEWAENGPAGELNILSSQPAAPRPGMTPVLASDRWALRNNLLALTAPVPAGQLYPAPDSAVLTPTVVHPAGQFVSPDGTMFIPVNEDFLKGTLYYGVKMADVLRTFGLTMTTPGKTFYVSDEEEEKTYSAKVDADGTLEDLKLFAERGGEGMVTGPDGKVYIAMGQIYVYSPEGKWIETIDVPERPINMIFGKDGRTLYILARTSLYSVETGAAPAAAAAKAK